MYLPIIIYSLLGISSILAVGIIIALFREKKSFQSDYLSEKETPDSKSANIIRQASKQARDILIRAELSGIKEVARSKHDTSKLEEAFDAHLNELVTRSSQNLEHTSKHVEEHYIKLFSNTEKFIATQIKDNQMRIVNQLDLVTKEAEKTIQTESAAAREMLAKRMEAELDAGKTIIREYKKKQMEFVDREIVDIVSRTIQRTLGKTLSKKDHADLVYKALEQAKQDGFFI
jgi:hypothetical protein